MNELVHPKPIREAKQFSEFFSIHRFSFIEDYSDCNYRAIEILNECFRFLRFALRRSELSSYDAISFLY